MDGGWSASNANPDGSARGDQKIRRLYAAAGGLIAVAACTLLFSARISSEMRDFEVYWTAASRAISAEPLYRAEDGHYQFKYLPAFALGAAPLAAVPLPAAKAVWFTISIGLLAALLVLSVRLLQPRRRPVWLLVLVMFLTMAKFFGHELVLGQVNLLFAVLVVTGMLAMRRHRDKLAPFLFVAAVVVKPYGVLFLPWLALRRGWIAAANAVLAMVLVLAAPVARYGFRGTIQLHQEWWTTVMTSTTPNLTNPDNASVAALGAKWLGDGGAIPAAILSAVLVGIAFVVIARGRELSERETLEGALLLTLIPLLSPQGWDYVFLIAAPAIGLIANYDDRLPPPLRAVTWLAVAAAGLSIYDVLGRQLYTRFMALSLITPCFMVVIGALTALRLRRVA